MTRGERGASADKFSLLMESAGSQLDGDAASQLLALSNALIASSGQDYRQLAILQLVDPAPGRGVFNSIVLHLNQMARQLATAPNAADRANAVRALRNLSESLHASLLQDEPPPKRPAESKPAVEPMTLAAAVQRVYEQTVWRTPHQSEIDTWLANIEDGLPFHEFVLLMSRSPEAISDANGIPLLVDRSVGDFVQFAHEHTQQRGAGGAELNHWMQKLESGEVARSAVLAKLFTSGVMWAIAQEEAVPHDGLTCRIMGTNEDLSAGQWQAQALENPTPPAHGDHERYHARFHIKSEPQVLVSVLTSLYRGGDFIEQFMDNITGQDIFDDYCELIIVDADSPENESETIKRYLSRHKNINYKRMNYRLGIYDAWNVAAQAARGSYLTNANLDDLRRSDSFSLQAATLDNLPFVDIVYQDLYYTFDPRLDFDRIAAFGHKTNLPIVTLHNLVEYNSPHNAPMWRKSLHDELGWFDTHLKSAGDYEFWFRCLAAGKLFYKINDPHVAYYQNPDGLSTRPGSRGVQEAMEIHKRYCRPLMPEEVTMSNAAFRDLLDPANAHLAPPQETYRYRLAHDALRNLARKQKFRGGGPA